MANILYFASLAETLGIRAEEIELSEACATVTALIAELRNRGKPFDSAFAVDVDILVAINQEMSAVDAQICNTDEIAFFPPITGG